MEEPVPTAGVRPGSRPATSLASRQASSTLTLAEGGTADVSGLSGPVAHPISAPSAVAKALGSAVRRIAHTPICTKSFTCVIVTADYAILSALWIQS